MSRQVQTRCDLVAIVTIDDHGDDAMVIKKNNGSTDDVIRDAILGTSITMELHNHPSYGEIVLPVIRRGQCQFNNRSVRLLIKEGE